jgi:hypothetical protein
LFYFYIRSKVIYLVYTQHITQKGRMNHGGEVENDLARCQTVKR